MAVAVVAMGLASGLCIAQTSPATAPASAAAGQEFTMQLKDVPPGITADFELWLPPNIGKGDAVRGLILASDYQAGRGIYDDPSYRALAQKLRMGMLRHKLFRKSGARNGPAWDKDIADALLKGLAELAKTSGHAEVAHACMIHTGLSWSGMQAPGLADALPERSIGVVTYHTTGFGEYKNAYGVPMLVLIAEYDQFMTPPEVDAAILKGRANGALWAGLYQAGNTHETLGDPAYMVRWIEQVVAMRLPKELPADAPAGLKAVDEKSGWLGELRFDADTQRRAQGQAAAAAFADYKGDKAKAYWLPSKSLAEDWIKATTSPDASPHARRPLNAVGSPQKPAPVPAAPGEITIDGDLADWAAVKPLPAPFDGREAGCLRLCWSPQGLYGAVTATGSRIVSNAQSPWKGDCLELFLDKAFTRAPKKSDTSVQYVFAPGADGQPAIIWPAEVKDQLQAAAVPTKDGYTLEFFIPAKVMAPAKLQAGTKIGLNYALSDDGKTVETFFCSKDFGGFAISALWGAIELLAAK
jgi:hypothetical protein